MSSALFVIRDQVSGEIIEAVDLAIAQCDDFRPVWRMYRPDWYASRRTQRRTSGRSTGAPWVPYKRTPERKRYQYVKAAIVAKHDGLGSTRAMSASEHRLLLNSLKPLTWPGKERLLPSLEIQRHPDAIWRGKATSLEIGTRVPYARNHDAGIGRAPVWAGGHRIPRRPLLRIGSDALRSLNDAVAEHAGAIAAEFGITRVGYKSDQVRAMQGV